MKNRVDKGGDKMKNNEQNKQTRKGIARPKEILEEVTKLRMFETTRQIVKFLKEEYGLASTVEATRPDEFIDVYLTNFKHDENIEIDLPEDKISKAILKTFNEIHKDEKLKAINVWPTEFGYTIILDKGENDETLKENYLYYYYYGEASNMYNKNNNEADENKNFNMRKPLQEAREEEEALLNKLTKRENETEDAENEDEYKQPNEENKDKQDQPREHGQDFDDSEEIEIDEPAEVKDKENIEQGIANKILDNRFIWFFIVMDEYTEELTEELDDLEEAIDYLIDLEEASMLVAFPYTDPSPEDEDVELVFADNPGPIILYDKED